MAGRRNYRVLNFPGIRPCQRCGTTPRVLALGGWDHLIECQCPGNRSQHLFIDIKGADAVGQWNKWNGGD